MKLSPILLLALLASSTVNAQPASKPIRVAIVGLVHGHVKGFLAALPKNPNAQLVAIVEPNTTLAQQYASQYHLPQSLFDADLEHMLTTQHPDAVLIYTTIQDHRRVIEAAAKHNISSMVEKPLSTTMDDALAIRRVAREHHVEVLVNYETTWYSSNADAISEPNPVNSARCARLSSTTDTKDPKRSASARSGCLGSPTLSRTEPGHSLISAATEPTS